MRRIQSTAAMIVITVLFVVSGLPMRTLAADPFVTNFRVTSVDSTSARVCWTAAIDVPPVSPKLEVSPYPYTSEIVFNPLSTTRGSEGWCSTVTGLTENTVHVFDLQYKSAALAGYSDYFVTGGYTTSDIDVQAAKSGLEFTTIDKPYAFPQEKIRLYGKNLGPKPANTGIYAVDLGK